MRLSEMKPGERATVKTVETTGEVAQRLLDMGMVKGTAFKIIRVAPLGDPIEIKLRGFMLALRVAEAKHIIVEKSVETEHDVPVKRKKS